MHGLIDPDDDTDGTMSQLRERPGEPTMVQVGWGWWTVIITIFVAMANAGIFYCLFNLIIVVIVIGFVCEWEFPDLVNPEGDGRPVEPPTLHPVSKTNAPVLNGTASILGEPRAPNATGQPLPDIVQSTGFLESSSASSS